MCVSPPGSGRCPSPISNDASFLAFPSFYPSPFSPSKAISFPHSFSKFNGPTITLPNGDFNSRSQKPHPPDKDWGVSEEPGGGKVGVTLGLFLGIIHTHASICASRMRHNPPNGANARTIGVSFLGSDFATTPWHLLPVVMASKWS